MDDQRNSHHLKLRNSPYLRIGVAVLLIIVFATGLMISLGIHRHYEILKVVAGAFASLLATALGACLAFWFARLQTREQFDLNERNAAAVRHLDRAQKRQELAFDMHREFSSIPMLAARDDASKMLDMNPELDYGGLYEKYTAQETRCLFIVTDFYDRLALAIVNDRIDKTLVPDLFGFYFVWWWRDVFETRVFDADPDYPESQRLKKLHDWIAANTTQELYASWVAQALKRGTSAAMQDSERKEK